MLTYARLINWSTSSAGTPISRATTIIGSLLATAAHPLDAPIAEIVRPQPVEGVGDKSLHARIRLAAS